jgi:hypothetical protein
MASASSSLKLVCCVLVSLYVTCCNASQKLNCSGSDAKAERGFMYDSYNDYDPDMATQDCQSPTENFHGTYYQGPMRYRDGSQEPSAYCTFQFHKSQGDAEDLDFVPSTVCGTDNTVLSPILESGGGWPDVCVGDFSRCYSLEVHSQIYLRFFCARGWALPDDATHVSVNCTADKTAKAAHRKKRKQQKQNYVILIVSSIVVGLGLLLAACWYFCKHRARKTARASREGELVGGTPEVDGTSTLFSVMLCGYWCLIRKVAGSTRWERDGLLREHGVERRVEEDDEQTTVVVTSAARDTTAAVMRRQVA